MWDAGDSNCVARHDWTIDRKCFTNEVYHRKVNDKRQNATAQRRRRLFPFSRSEKLDKRFGATHALKAVDLTFEEGEIHAIVGENGAGKSTLIKVLTAVHPRTSGEVYWRGKSVPLANPPKSIGLGINAVHQEVVLCPHLTVAANIFLGDEEMRGGLLDKKRMERDAQKLCSTSLASPCRPTSCSPR